jgi:hypothetical protein
MFFCLIKAFKSKVNDDCIKFISFLKGFLNKYILDSLGYAPAQKIQADINSDIQITIED